MPTQVNSDFPGVAGPASAVNNDIAVYDGTSGKLIKDGAQTIAQIIAAGGAAAAFTFADVVFNAADFAATLSMTWTVASGDVTLFRYALLGKMMILWLNVTTTTVGGTVAGANLTLKLPNGALAAKNATFNALAAPAGAALESIAVAAAAGSNLLTLLRYSGNWVLGADNTALAFAIAIEIQ